VPELDPKLQSKIPYIHRLFLSIFSHPVFQFKISQFEGMNVFTDFAVRVGCGILFLQKIKKIKADLQCKIRNKRNSTCLTLQVLNVSPGNIYIRYKPLFLLLLLVIAAV